jgi:purine-binding chemotaxis protein CheW
MSKQESQRYLLFTIAGLTYAIDLQQVAEVVEPPPLSPIPRAPVCYIGAMNSHGSIKAVLDLTHVMPTGTCSRSGGKVLVLEDRVAGLALQVDGVLSITSGEMLDRQPAGDDLPWCDWLLTDGISDIRLLAVEKLLQRLEATING